MVLSAADWYSVIRGFQYAVDGEFQGTVVVGDQPSDLIDLALRTLLPLDERDDALKTNILVFLQEHARVLLSDVAKLELLCSCLTNAIHGTQQSVNVYPLKAQILVTVTTILIEFDALDNHRILFQNFISLLIDIVREANSSHNRYLRSQACDCLREIELAYPGLLSASLGHLYPICQIESTNALQSYFMLLTTLMENTVLKKALQTDHQLGLPTSIFSAKEALTPFVISKSSEQYPPLPRATPQQGSASIPQIFQQDVQKVVGLIVDHSHLFTQWALVSVILSLERILRTLKLSPSVLKNQFSGILFSTSPILAHLGFCIALQYSSLFGDDFVQVAIKRILNLSADIFTIPEMRIAALTWLQDLHPDIQKRQLVKNLREFYPTAFEMLDIKVAKIMLLVRMSSLISTPIHPRQLIRSLDSLSDYHYRSRIGRHTLCAFEILSRMVQSSPEMFQQVIQYQLDLISQRPKFIAMIIAFVNRLSKENPGLAFKFLSSYNIFLVSTVPHHRIHEYFLLLVRIIQDPRIHPQDSITFLMEFLKNYAEEGDWELGNQFLAVVRILILHHPAQSIFASVSELLHYCHTNYADTDIRDRAGYYLTLFTHVQGEKLSQFLLASTSDAETGATIENHAYPIVLPTTSVSLSFIHLQAIQPEVMSHMICPQGIDAFYTGNVVDDYLAITSHADFRARIQILLRLQLNKKIMAESLSIDRIFTLKLKFLFPGTINSPSRDYHIPYIAADPENQMSPQVAFPYSYKVDLAFEPSEIVSGAIGLQATFCDFSGKVYMGSLDSAVTIRLFDILVPIIPPSYASGPAPEKALSSLFDYLWEHVHTPKWCAHPKRSKTANIFGAESVKILDSTQLIVTTRIQERLSRFIIADKAASDGRSRVVNIMALVPPRFHLLLQFTVDESSTLARIRTDSWALMSQMDEFFVDLIGNRDDTAFVLR
eukprot:TRINITY_DN7573_c0_g1_i1.p1 TRINITY_DN7573_c0_g1~~TRINITY_DN7573_c0_g1_i1.p1  ORF type:complete len:944 (+),score=176.78 TRINITY_DN7573_c0_g1_i1:62-2893(+)